MQSQCKLVQSYLIKDKLSISGEKKLMIRNSHCSDIAFRTSEYISLSDLEKSNKTFLQV